MVPHRPLRGECPQKDGIEMRQGREEGLASTATRALSNRYAPMAQGRSIQQVEGTRPAVSVSRASCQWLQSKQGAWQRLM